MSGPPSPPRSSAGSAALPPRIHRSFPLANDAGTVPVWCVTPDVKGCIHRFYDTSPISPSGRYLAVTRLPFEDRLPSPGDVADIVVVDLVEGGHRIVARTRGWDSQLGAQAQWGSEDAALYYNDVDPGRWTPFGVRFNVFTGESRPLKGTVYMVAPDGRSVASPCLRRMSRTQRGYGVVVPDEHVPENRADRPAEDDGITITDAATGRARLLVSLAEIVRETGLPAAGPGEGALYGFHVKWNSRGDRLMYVVRRLGEKGRLASHLVTMNADGSGLRVAATWQPGQGNHPNWSADGKAILMNRNPAGDRMHFVTFKPDGSDLRIVADRCAGSGHPTEHPSGNILTDAYLWDGIPVKDGKVPLRWIDPVANRETAIAYVGADAGPDGLADLRLDPHPAWDRTFRRITFNGILDGERRVFVADLSEFLRGKA